MKTAIILNILGTIFLILGGIFSYILIVLPFGLLSSSLALGFFISSLIVQLNKNKNK